MLELLLSLFLVAALASILALGFYAYSGHARRPAAMESAPRATILKQRLRSWGGLSDTERDIAYAVVAGWRRRAIAVELNITRAALNYHIFRIYSALGVHTRQDLDQVLNQIDDARLKS